MNPKELLKRSQNSPTVAFHKFVLLHRKNKSDLFCFYEGKDAQYYYPRIKDRYGDKHHPIICGNKKSVVKVFEKVQSKYKTIKTAFFIDSDYDNKIYEDKIYNTPCYSIENLYCSESVLARILKNEFLLSEIDNEYKTIIELFNKNQKDYHNATKLFNMWYATAKNKAKAKNTITNVSLNDKFPKDFVSLKIGTITSNYELKNIKEKYPDALEVSEEEIKEYELNVDNKKPFHQIFRGKYEIEFILTFLKFLIEDANKHKNILKNKTTLNIEKAQILSQLSQYSETPKCLIEYIKNCA
ncbi:DUF4435 domain-containing protein [Cellulophaga sp. HaHa_2_1]|uniref:DUF4435 domain-containing protein n=1 Tax=Cellulophaga sp. HaHa_2_1 TaxID=2749994 RepID=UPI001C4EA79F|nr:DUF4435 domain-containing protein [Cellulophaga sp. HaHa_2_1]QXP54140.1 DUF4435 domain-containing protein [Cellulophaga sp. HaHa_2_1]